MDMHVSLSVLTQSILGCKRTRGVGVLISIVTVPVYMPNSNEQRSFSLCSLEFVVKIRPHLLIY